MTDNDSTTTKTLALLIDGDNVRSRYLPIIFREASAIGTIAIKRVYGHFASPIMNSWQPLLHEYAITPVHVPPAAKAKNATDMKLAIEAMDMLHQKRLDGFCIASSDSDFTNLASRIREEGLLVYGFGEKKSTAPYVAACDRFFYCDVLLEEEQEEKEEKEPRKSAPPKAKILSAVEDASGDDGWATLNMVGQILNKRMPDFDSRNYGYRKLSELVADVSYLETRKAKSNGGFNISVKKKQAARRGKKKTAKS